MTVVAVVGPTASGKSDIAMRIATELGAAIVSVDSMQVYRDMNIGTAKPTPADLEAVPHHLIDMVDPEEPFTVGEFQREGRRVLEALAGSPVVIAGGSGLHFRSLVDPLEFPPHDRSVRHDIENLGHEAAVARLVDVDPEAGTHVDLANPRRVVRALEVYELTGETPTRRQASPASVAVREYTSEIAHVTVGVDPGDELEDRVVGRFDAMLDAGLLAEVTKLAPRLGETARAAVGYKQLLGVVDGSMELAAGRAEAIAATLGLAKRQRTFFRRDPRVHWVSWKNDPDARFRRVVAALEEAGAWTS
ncbi:MAG: tRNA (adenosine(37)-N6)-dimethylallyltransferase MiaA [Acidimicrobiia bacterium]|nr:tRNA (adenosine(37)-N6)-dimethylallyltransferase MiaA [Acidimicrobiia bacterium]